VLLDECVDSRFATQFEDVEIRTVVQQGWSGVTNGKLLALASEHFDVFVTVDRNLQYQQHLPKYNIAVVLMLAPSNRLSDLVGLLPKVMAALPEAKKGGVHVVGA
jgi:hypothetical protein